MPTSPGINWPGFGLGIHAWILQTYLQLKAVSFPCQFVTDIPDSGIVLVHHNILRSHRRKLMPTPTRVIVCINAEASPAPSAQLQIVQNPAQANSQQHCYFLPHWPQPGLIPRQSNRGNVLKTVAFMGHVNSLASELRAPAWASALKAMGLQWQPITNHNRWDCITAIDNRWNDYSQIDLIVAVRSFDPRQRRIHRQYQNKPATKLYNAWLAGVPALLGPEVAYQKLRQTELDYIEVTNVEQVLTAIHRLQTVPAYYQALVNRGCARALDVYPNVITQQWLSFLENTAIPYYEKWCLQRSYRRAWQLYCQYWTFTSRCVFEKARMWWLGQGQASIL